MAPHTFQAEADARIADAFLLVVALVLVLAPFIVSVVANIGRRVPSRRRTKAPPTPRREAA